MGRFPREREEGVKGDVFAALGEVLAQVGVYRVGVGDWWGCWGRNGTKASVCGWVRVGVVSIRMCVPPRGKAGVGEGCIGWRQG